MPIDTGANVTSVKNIAMRHSTVASNAVDQWKYLNVGRHPGVS